MVRGNFFLETSKVKVSGNTHGKALGHCGFKCSIWVPLCGLCCYCTGEGSYKIPAGFHYPWLLLSVWSLCTLQTLVILKLKFYCFSTFPVSLCGIKYAPDIPVQHSSILDYKAYYESFIDHICGKAQPQKQRYYHEYEETQGETRVAGTVNHRHKRSNLLHKKWPRKCFKKSLLSQVCASGGEEKEQGFAEG